MKHKIQAILSLLLISLQAFADNGMEYGADIRANAGSGNFAPSLIMANRDGKVTQPDGIALSAHLRRSLDLSRRFDYGFGGEITGQWTKPTSYMRYNAADAAWEVNRQRPGAFVLQSLWGEVKFRGVFLTAGMKPNDRSLFDSSLASGDITLSRNARPVPQVRAGFIDFQNVPFTRGWLQIQGELAYGKFADSNWLRNHYNYYNDFITTGAWMHYARLYFRSDPHRRLSVTIGMQHAAQFGGEYTYYFRGKTDTHRKDKISLKTFFDVMIPRRDGSGPNAGDQAYYTGNHLGSWDLLATYRFRDNSTLTFSWQSPWEDGSGIGKLNGFDGVYSLEYRFREGFPIRAARFEYLDFRNQSGPIHWAPGDHAGTGMTGEATGNDDYYNNFNFNGWANYGQSLGTPFLPGPIFNRNGTLAFLDNRIYGFHAGVEAEPMEGLSCRVLFEWRRSAGRYYRPRLKKRESVSMLFGGEYKIKNVKGLSATLDVAFDSGSLLGAKCGIMAGVQYNGSLSFRSRKN